MSFKEVRTWIWRANHISNRTSLKSLNTLIICYLPHRTPKWKLERNRSLFCFLWKWHHCLYEAVLILGHLITLILPKISQQWYAKDIVFDLALCVMSGTHNPFPFSHPGIQLSILAKLNPILWGKSMNKSLMPPPPLVLSLLWRKVWLNQFMWRLTVTQLGLTWGTLWNLIRKCLLIGS